MNRIKNETLKTQYLIILLFMLILRSPLHAQSTNIQSDIESISESLMCYIDGTRNGEIEKIKKAFHPDFKLYSVTETGKLRVLDGEYYLSKFSEGRSLNRIGRITSIDIESNIATAKVEIEIPGWRVYTDLFLLLKYDESWKIVHKSYTWKDASEFQEESKLNSNSQSITKLKLKEARISSIDEWLLKNNGSTNYEINESTLNALAYNLLANPNKIEDALLVFQLILELYPNSSNAHDSAGEGLLTAGDYENSIKYYRQAIKLNNKPHFHQLGYVTSNSYIPTSIENDTVKLFETKGDWDNEIAFVYMQGGPDIVLNISQTDPLHLMTDDPKTLKIYPYQAQIINPDIVTCSPMMTAKQSAFENSQSVEILERVIKYLVDRNKRVFLIGFSYGASICMEYLHTRDNLTQKIVLMGLDLDEDVSSWDLLKSGEYIRWEHGKTPYSKKVFEEIPNEHPLKSSFDRVADNLGRLVKNNMENKYSTIFTAEDFQNLISVYATEDESNGAKSLQEIVTLKQKGSAVIKVRGDHHDMINSELMTNLFEHLIHQKQLILSY